MLLQTAADTIELIGHIVIAYTAIAVHERVRKEHKITKAVYREMHRERKFALIGIALIVSGYILELYADYFV